MATFRTFGPILSRAMCVFPHAQGRMALARGGSGTDPTGYVEVEIGTVRGGDVAPTTYRGRPVETPGRAGPAASRRSPRG